MGATAFLSERDNLPLMNAETDDAVRAFRLLGGQKVIKQTVRNSLDAHDVIVKGISSQALLRLWRPGSSRGLDAGPCHWSGQPTAHRPAFVGRRGRSGGKHPDPDGVRGLRVTPLPPPLGTGELRFWRLDQRQHAPTWHTGEGSYRVGGRWNSQGVRAVYTSLDPATAIMEVAVHKGFRALDTAHHVLTSARVIDPARVHVLDTADIPNANWLVPGSHGAGQKGFGDALLRDHLFVLIPSRLKPAAISALLPLPVSAVAT